MPNIFSQPQPVFLSLLLKIVLLTGFLAIVFYFVDVPAAIRIALNLSLGSIAILFGIHVVHRVLMGLKWGVLLWWNGGRVSALLLVKAYFISAFSAPFLPPSVGADAVRWLLVLDKTEPVSLVLPSMIVEKLLASLAMAWMAIGVTALLLGFDNSSNPAFLLPATLSAVGIIVVVLLFPLLFRFPLLWRLLECISVKASTMAREALEGAMGIMSNRLSSVSFFLLSVLEQMIPIAFMVFLSQAMRIDVPIYTISLITIIVLFIGRIPVLVSSFAFQDGAMVVLLTANEIALEEATALALAARALEFLFNLPAVMFMGGVTASIRKLLVGRGRLLGGGSS